MQEEPIRPPGPPAGSPSAAPSGRAATPSSAGPAPAAGPAAAAFAGEDDEPFAAAALTGAGDGGDDEPFDAEAYYNPFSGPPEGDDAWLARVASPVADEYLASLKPPAGAREVLAAGFTHRDHEPGARGFAAGGPLDVMEPGAVLAGFTDDAIDDGLNVLSDDELVGLMGAARRLASRAAGIELAAIAGLNGRRNAHARAVSDWRQAEHVADEVAVALTLTCRAADKLLDLANGVRRLPAVTAALAAGRVDLPKATVYVNELAGLGDVPAAAIAAVTITDAPGLTTSELGEVLRRAVLAHDPEAARKRRERAQKDARVETWVEYRGTAALAGRDMPPAAVLAADQHIDGLARQLKAAGAPGTLEQLRAKVFLALLTSQPLYTLLPGNETQDGDCQGGCGGQGRNADSNSDGDWDGPADSGGQGGNADGGSPDSHGTGGNGDRPGDDGDGDSNGDRPGEDDGDGPSNGNQGGGSRRPGPGTGSGPSGGWPGPGGGQALPPGLAGSVNLTMPLATWLGLSGQPGEAAGHGPLNADTSRDLASLLAARAGNRWCLTIIDPAGHAAGHGCAHAGPGPPGHHSHPHEWLAGVKIRWLETGACGHARETFTYQPSPVLRHLIKNRDRTCSFPGCRRPARRCDDDHTVPFDQGGRSCECNLSPLCRRHHAAKQAPGWHLRQSQPGHLKWTLPSGRIRTVTPRPYAA